MNEMNHHQKLAKRLALLWAISYAAAGAISFVWTLVRYQNTEDYMIPILSAQHLFIQFILLLYLYPLLALVYHHSKRRQSLPGAAAAAGGQRNFCASLQSAGGYGIIITFNNY